VSSKNHKIQHFDELASSTIKWREKNKYYHAELLKLLAFIVPPHKKILEIGCGSGELLDELKPSEGVGIDFSGQILEIARSQFPHLQFRLDEAEYLTENAVYDYVVLSDLLGELDDVWMAFHNLHKVSDRYTRVIITNYNYLWEPLLRAGQFLGLKSPQEYQNWLSLNDIERLLSLNNYEVITANYFMLLPVYIPLVSTLFNRYLCHLPFINKLCMVQYLVARETPTAIEPTLTTYSISVIIPCRNEVGNIEETLKRIPIMSEQLEIIFVDGASTDGTIEKIEQMICAYKKIKNISLIHQVTEESRDLAAPHKMLKLGKGDAVRKGFAAATGDILMILDADLTVPPEELPKFYHAITYGKGELINGTRLVYQMEQQAMRTLNLLANKFFSIVFTWLLGQPIKDTLCGTKVLFRKDYERIREIRHRFGTQDPFGDFDLLFGAAMLNMKIVEVPVRYCRRTYGEIKIERFKHGLKLIRMSMLGMIKFKFRG
jgi:glycosyltransferase involved in cell wall biosynthesis/ubiquinone/menaquinone biosynthesis C-methylase UbiE